MTFIWPYVSPLGGMTMAADGTALTGLWFDGQAHAPAQAGPQADLPVFAQAARWLDRYFAGEQPGDPPPVRLNGTPFQMAVWALLREIPYGETTTYGALARRLAAQTGAARVSAQAVGGAVGRNPVSILVPCHRVVGADGSLTGYAGGLARKRQLLRLERSDMSRLHMPGQR